MTRIRLLKRNAVGLALFMCVASNPSYSSGNGPDLFSLSLEELMQVEVEVAGKKKQRLYQIPQTVHVITRQQIRENGYRNIMEALADQPGFQLQKNWYLDRLVVRGQRLSLDKILLLVDGQTMAMKSDNYNILNGAAPVEIEDIENIEVLMGPSSTLYGSGAFVGVINVKTRDNTEGVRLTARAASPDEKGLHFAYGARISSYKLSLSASSMNSNGESLSMYFPDGTPPVYDEFNVSADGFNTLTANRASVKLKDEQLEFRAQLSRSSIGWPNSLFGTDFNDHGNRYDINQTSLQLKYHQEYLQTLMADTRVYYNDSEGLWKGVYEGELYLAPDGEEYSGKYYGLEYKLEYQASEEASIISGLEYTQNKDIRSIDYVDNFDNISLFGLAEFRLNNDLELEVGARAEKYSYYDDYEILPQLGMFYHLTPHSHINLAYGKGFIAPSTWIRQTADFVETQTPASEKFESVELSFYQQFESYATNISLYQSKQVDNIKIVYNVNTPVELYNSGDEEYFWGVEWSNDVRLSSKSSLLFNASYVDAKANPEDKATHRLPGVTSTTINAGLRTVLFNDQILTLKYNYVGAMEGFPDIGAWSRVDVSWYNSVFFGHELTLKLVNLFDEKITTYEDSSGAVAIPDRGRHLMLIFSARF
ncbi:outer membrane receptor for ferrienterochelin and colicin [Alteromonadaceae bacterium 2753L.S.0a.02]|nr:outer membrane receptor for ferrienterochelin and colicin [Alteromonadaceae bacterium 2753L.S.0a.02]